MYMGQGGVCIGLIACIAVSLFPEVDGGFNMDMREPMAHPGNIRSAHDPR